MPFDKAAATALLDSAFAPWVQSLNLTVETVGDGRAALRMAFSDQLCRDNGVVCGQSLMALADTAMVIAISSAAGGYGPMTTVDQTTHFLRGAQHTDVIAHAHVTRLGRTMAFGSVAMHAENDERPVATAQTAYAILAERK